MARNGKARLNRELVRRLTLARELGIIDATKHNQIRVAHTFKHSRQCAEIGTYRRPCDCDPVIIGETPGGRNFELTPDGRIKSYNWNTEYTARVRRGMMARRPLLLAALVALHRLYPRHFNDVMTRPYGEFQAPPIRYLQKRLATLRRFRNKWPEVRDAHIAADRSALPYWQADAVRRRAIAALALPRPWLDEQ